MGMTGILLTTDLNADQRECAESIRSSADSLLVLVNDILDHSKIEAGKMDIEEIDFDPTSLMRDVWRSFHVTAKSKGLELKVDISPEMPGYLRGDPTRLRQILSNLVSNALKFTEDGSVRLAAQFDETYRVHFSVTDTGIGIPTEAQKSLFSPFQQADASTSRRFGGTGLGLAISKRLVEMMVDDFRHQP